MVDDEEEKVTSEELTSKREEGDEVVEMTGILISSPFHLGSTPALINVISTNTKKNEKEIKRGRREKEMMKWMDGELISYHFQL